MVPYKIGDKVNTVKGLNKVDEYVGIFGVIREYLNDPKPGWEYVVSVLSKYGFKHKDIVDILNNHSAVESCTAPDSPCVCTRVSEKSKPCNCKDVDNCEAVDNCDVDNDRDDQYSTELPYLPEDEKYYKVVYKYTFPINDKFTLRLPQSHQILKVEYQKGVPCMWVLLDRRDKLLNFDFLIAGTGHLIKDKFLYHTSTFMNEEQTLVWHLFYVNGR